MALGVRVGGLPSEVLVTIAGGTTVSMLCILAIVMNWLFPKSHLNDSWKAGLFKGRKKGDSD